jgi:hypothetical protein
VSRWRNSSLGLVALMLLADLLLALPATRYGAAFALLWLLPGLTWARYLTHRERRATGEDVAIGLGLGMGAVTLLTLLLHYLPGPILLPVLLILVNLFTLIFTILRPRTPPFDFKGPRSSLIVHCSLLILVIAFFRLTHLDYSEFQGDEAVVMTRAARAILGDEAQLFYHQKGPVEVLIPTATWTLSGTINEWQARLPFAFASILGVVGFYWLARRWFNERTALIAALLLAINGYFVGFGRIVQYQSFVLAMTTLALLALWRWSEGEGRRWLVVGAALLAFGLLAHYDAVLTLPAAAYIVGRRPWTERLQRRRLAVDVLCAGALACGILALFYVPFTLNPNFAKTLSYLSDARIGAVGPLYNNLRSSFPLATFYNSSYYLVGLAGLIVVASFLPFRRLGFLVPATCYLLVLFRPPLWTGPILAGLLIAVLLSPRSSPSFRAAWLWFGVPFLFYYFLVWDPRTHVLNAFSGAILLAAFTLDHLLTAIFSNTPSLRLPLLIVHCLLFIVLAYYPYLMFVQHDPEIKRTWPAHQPTLYWKPGAQTPLFGYFGFPYQAGWKVVGGLIEEGVLSGVYASNEEPQVARWYARGMVRTYCPDPDWYLIAQNVQDEMRIDWAEIDAAYELWGEIWVAGKPKLWIYRRSSLSPQEGVALHAVYHVEDYVSRFDARATPTDAVQPPHTDYIPAGYTLGETVRLLGYQLDATNARPGGSISLALYWEALGPVETNYQVFNHLYDAASGTMWGQRDGTPGCARQPTVWWEPGQMVRDEYVIPIDLATPPGDIPLLVGMYTLDVGERLPVRDANGLPVGDAIPLTVVVVR